ncbi:deaminase [Trinickia terrae]|uniref:Deaminase n=1 Tax=Trinickia terrae TaxID=2571161 RepID=A0A4U1IBK3_9BURK|nr:PP0621 family protein [Trinickia terrae]TKC90946.1 deaminase [Trinickia terrae]
MRQLLLLILLFFAGQWLVKTLRRAGNAADAPRNGPFDAAGGPGANNGNADAAGGGAQTRSRRLAEPMVRCATCGVHTPQSESILVAGQRFCCTEHAERYAARPSGRTAR